MGKKQVRAGLIGCGTIGGGVIRLFKENGRAISEKIDAELILAKIVDRQPAKTAKFGLPEHICTEHAADVIDNPEIDLVIELVGGIEPAYTFIRQALEKGKYVVTANKDLLATHGAELIELARASGVNIFYEASVGGGIPLIRPLKYGLIADRLTRITGIVNGTTNYILTRMTEENLSFAEALLKAQELGFAEADPTNDIEGHDAVFKLVIMAGLGFGASVRPEQVPAEGITGVTRQDIAYAAEIGSVIKLVAIGEKEENAVALRVHPALVPNEHPLASVRNEYNAVLIEGESVGQVMFYGPGAGAGPTATAVMADVTEAARSVATGCEPGVLEKSGSVTTLIPTEDIESRFFLRFLAEDRSGVLAAVSAAFADERVSLDMVIQKRRVSDMAEIVLVTQLVEERAFKKALDQVMGLPVIRPGFSVFRLLA